MLIDNLPVELGAFFGVVAWIFVAWWAGTWGRSVIWALIGGLLLTPLVWGAVLLVLGRNED